MKIAFDGGAFQQDIQGGIFTVSVGLLNAAAAADPQFCCVLVADPRLGPVREALLAQLNVRPEIIYGEVAAAFDPPLRGITTDDPRIRFEIDGRVFTPQANGLSFTYTGKRPRESFHMRTAQPIGRLRCAGGSPPLFGRHGLCLGTGEGFDGL